VQFVLCEPFFLSFNLYFVLFLLFVIVFALKFFFISLIAFFLVPVSENGLEMSVRVPESGE